MVIGEIDGKFYAFVGLERVGGIMVYDITDPASATFVQYLNNRDFSAAVQLPDGSTNPAAGDLGPEGLTFIAAADSPNGQPLLVVANEVSGTTTIYEIQADPQGSIGVLISEFQPNPAGNDPATSTFELSGTPGETFNGWIVSLESDGASGIVDQASAVSGTFDTSGLLVVDVPDLETLMRSLTAQSLREAFPEVQACLDYQVLCYLQAHKHLSRSDTQQCIATLCEEALFEIASAEAITFSHNPQQTLVPPF
ncbi:MAG: hypothetical protein HC929_12195 [Leptolyngbyaceae cyanobacterium SM2_5_2]|nr:hypothetical protein [Leptolyngbyaceae cyanobacterium SM2_5_2]